MRVNYHTLCDSLWANSEEAVSREGVSKGPCGSQAAVRRYELDHTAATARCARRTALQECGRDAARSLANRSVIALWLGHESVETTQIYLDANLALKEDALKKTSPLNGSVGRFKPDDQLLAFLRNL